MSYADRARPALASMLMVLAIAGLAVLSVWPTTADAAVEGIEILAREPVAGGAAFGAAGIYEKIRGRASFAVDPATPTNAAIADLALAPRDAQGLVHFSADFLMLRPAEAARSNGTLIYEVNNRGTLPMLVQLNEAPATNDPTSAADFGNGFLLQQGFTMLWSAWAWDIAADPKEKRLVLRPPVATRQGEPITGEVAYEFLVNFPSTTARFTGILGLPYPFAQEGAPDAKLTSSGATREQTTGGFPHSLEIRAVARWWIAATATAGGRIPTGAPLRTHLHRS
jgi:hypothetical protein